MGIAILSWLHIVGSGLGSVVAFLALQRLWRNSQALSRMLEISFPPAALALGVALILVVACVSGIGMWIGSKWGWFLGSFCYAYWIALNLNALIRFQWRFSSLSAQQIAAVKHSPTYYLLNHALRAILGILLYLYFFKVSVISYFGLSSLKKWKALAAHLALCLLFFLSFSLTRVLAPSAAQKDLVALDAMLRRGEYEEALREGREYVLRHPESVKGWSLLGWSYLRLEQDEQAFDCFFKAIDLDPVWDNCYVGLGVLYRRSGDLAEARKCYRRAIQIAPDNAEAFSSLLVIELLEGNTEKAVEYGEKAWALRQDLPSIPANLAIAYHYLGDTGKRDLYYTHAARLGHHNLEGLRDTFEGRTSVR